jgi:hypothetical protein
MVGGCRRWNLDHDTAIDKKTQLIDVEVLALGLELPLEQSVQVRLERRGREYPDFCVLSHTLPKEREYGDQERDFG